MAIYSLNIKSIGKTTHKPGTAGAHIRYITRKKAASKVLAMRMPVRPLPAQKWIDAEEAQDRKNARVADKVLVALPLELTSSQRAALVHDFMEELTHGRAPWMAAVHDKTKDKDNPHAHILVRDRDLQTGKRVILMSEKGAAHHVRSLWERKTNEHLERAGHEQRIDRRTLKEQGIEREPTIHEGVTARVLEERDKTPVSQSREYRNPRKGTRTVRYRRIDKGVSRTVHNRAIQKRNRSITREKTLSKENQKAPERPTTPLPKDEPTQEPQVVDFVDAQNQLMIFRRHEQRAQDAGELLRERQRTHRTAENQRKRDLATLRYHENQIDELMEVYRQPGMVRQRLDQLAKENRLHELIYSKQERWKVWSAALTGKGRFALGYKRGVVGMTTTYRTKSSKKYRTPAQIDRAILKHYLKIREAQQRYENREMDVALKKARVEAAKKTFIHTKEHLGDHLERNTIRKNLYRQRDKSLRKVKSKDIWMSDLPEDQKQELAREWERQQQFAAEQYRYEAYEPTLQPHEKQPEAPQKERDPQPGKDRGIDMEPEF